MTARDTRYGRRGGRWLPDEHVGAADIVYGPQPDGEWVSTVELLTEARIERGQLVRVRCWCANGWLVVPAHVGRECGSCGAPMRAVAKAAA